jgi:hypothetical protein
MLISEGVTGDVSAIQWDGLHASAGDIPEGMMSMMDAHVPAHITTKYPK